MLLLSLIKENNVHEALPERGNEKLAAAEGSVLRFQFKGGGGDRKEKSGRLENVLPL